LTQTAQHYVAGRIFYGTIGDGSERSRTVPNRYTVPNRSTAWLVEGCPDPGKKFFGYGHKGWEFMPD